MASGFYICTSSHLINSLTDPGESQKSKEPAVSTPKQQPQNHLAVNLDAEAKQKSTPGHETAASLKPAVDAKTVIGSAQDFHSIFHPAPLFKTNPLNVPSTPN